MSFEHMTDEQWLESWKREAPELTLEEYKAECSRQLAFVTDAIDSFLGRGKDE